MELRKTEKKMPHPKLSIIIPHYNMSGHLKKLLDTIPCSEDVQTIVIDDRSNEFLDEYETLKSNYPDVIFVRNEGAKGAGAARNVGLKIAKGDWILFADSDDTFLVGFYNIVSKWFHEDVDIVYFPPESFYCDSGKEVETYQLYKDYMKDYQNIGTKQTEQILRYMWHVPWSRLIRKEIIDKHRVTYSEILRNEDLLFAIKVGHYAKKIAVSDESIYRTELRSAVLHGVQTRPFLSEDVVMSFFSERIEKYCFLRDALPENEFKALPLHGIMLILRIILDKQIRAGHAVKYLPKIIKMCRKHRVRFFHKGFFGSYILRMSKKWFRRKRNMKNIQYYETKNS